VQRVVVVVPCFNEEPRLDRAEFIRLARSRGDLALLFVDDGSRDRTAHMIDEWSRETPTIGLCRLPSNVGKAEAVRFGLQQALASGAEVVAYVDADLATPVDEILRLLELTLSGGWAVVLAARVRLLGSAVERKLARHYLGRIFATLASMALRLPIYDTQCGAKFFRRTPELAAALSRPFRSPWAFDVELLGRLARGFATAPPLRIEAFIEVPLRRWRDVGGSKMHLLAMMRAALDVLALVLRSLVGRA
jgi:glycosyltransferase involved in cell wall biosynthesis